MHDVDCPFPQVSEALQARRLTHVRDPAELVVHGIHELAACERTQASMLREIECTNPLCPFSKHITFAPPLLQQIPFAPPPSQNEPRSRSDFTCRRTRATNACSGMNRVGRGPEEFRRAMRISSSGRMRGSLRWNAASHSAVAQKNLERMTSCMGTHACNAKPGAFAWALASEGH